MHRVRGQHAFGLVPLNDGLPSERAADCTARATPGFITPARGATMKNSTKDKAKGAMHEVKGKIKEETGKLIDDPELEARGTGEKLAGKAQKTVGKIEKKFGK